MKRDVMRLGEDQLYSRYTNLRQKQRQEEEEMQKMLGNSTEQGVFGKVQQKSKLVKMSMLDKKKFVVDIRSSEEPEKTVGKKPLVGSSMAQLVGNAAASSTAVSKGRTPMIFTQKKPQAQF